MKIPLRLLQVATLLFYPGLSFSQTDRIVGLSPGEFNVFINPGETLTITLTFNSSIREARFQLIDASTSTLKLDHVNFSHGNGPFTDTVANTPQVVKLYKLHAWYRNSDGSWVGMTTKLNKLSAKEFLIEGEVGDDSDFNDELVSLVFN